MDLDQLLKLVVDKDASDGFITADAPPSVKINGRLHRVGKRSLDAVEVRQAILDASGGAVLTRNGEALRYTLRDDLINPPFIAVSDRDYDWSAVLAETDWPEA